jgi:2-desacetyl-2-hydroxyethyl bacteriochlorophyllide A dehydrogenase
MERSYRAAYLSGPSALEIREAPLPGKLASGYFLSDVNYCAICGSDRGFWNAGVKKVVLGHEICATVTDPGDTDLKAGERVCMYPGIPCWECESCRQGRDNICTTIYYNGYTGLSADGGYAEKYVGCAAYAFRVPEHVSSEAAALVEPLATAVHAVHQSHLKLGDKVLVVGAGPIGLYCGALAKKAGASLVAVSEYNSGRLAAAKRLSELDGYFEASDPDLNAKLKQACSDKGEGFDVVFECAASEAGYATAAAVSKYCGEVIMVGLTAKPMGIVPQFFALKEISIIPSMGYTLKEFEQALNLIAGGAVSPEKLVTRVVSLGEIQGAFEQLFQDPANTDLKVLVKPRP